MFEGNPRSDHDEIAAYEGLLKGIPQIQLVSNDDVSNRVAILFVYIKQFVFMNCLY